MILDENDFIKAIPITLDKNAEAKVIPVDDFTGLDGFDLAGFSDIGNT